MQSVAPPLIEHPVTVRRYLSFARFLWLLHNKALWLSRADLLGDPWELALAGDQLAHVLSRHPITTLPFTDKCSESGIERARRIIGLWRETTFVNCWSASDEESHALWRIYCPTAEGLAIQTTLEVLKASVAPVAVYRITYGPIGSIRRTPERSDLISRKRPMFAYENEVRIVYTADGHSAPRLPTGSFGYQLPWDVEKLAARLLVHPEADQSFIDTVTATVAQLAPALVPRIAWSDMREPPPT